MNIKKLFPENKTSKKNVLEFLDKKGFYIVLIFCIVIVGATVLFVATHNATSPDYDFNAQNIIPEEMSQDEVRNIEEKVAAQTSISPPTVGEEQQAAASSVSDPCLPADQGGADAKADQPVEIEDLKASAVPSDGSNKNITNEQVQKFISPVFGEVIFNFSQGSLVYSKTLEEWRTHSGVDLEAERGTVVKAAGDGVVSDIKNDPRLGIIIIIDHQNGIKTVYGNLAGEDMVNVNQKVKQGEAVGVVGNTAYFESAEKSHLHFEVLRNDKPVDPVSYLPEKVK